MTGRVTLFTIVASGGLFYYVAYKDRTPGPQLPHDPSKKTLVILGSGWGATSLLNSLDTSEYNVVRRYRKLRYLPYMMSLVSDRHQPTQLLPLHPSSPQCGRWNTQSSVNHSTYVPSDVYPIVLKAHGCQPRVTSHDTSLARYK